MVTSTQRVEDKVALVTGGASGLGFAIASRLATEGATTIITDIQPELGKSKADEVGASFYLHDVSDENQWKRVLGDIKKIHGRLDILVNNAGISGQQHGADPVTTTLEEWQSIQKINSDSVFLGCKYAVEFMQENGGGSIINLSSIAALVATPFLTAYGASKAAVRQLTMSVAMHCAGSGVRCNSVHPGQIKTSMLDNLFANAARDLNVPVEEVEKGFLEKIPIGEFGEPDDIASMILFLASDEAKHITGAQFVVDGGMQLNG